MAENLAGLCGIQFNSSLSRFIKLKFTNPKFCRKNGSEFNIRKKCSREKKMMANEWKNDEESIPVRNRAMELVVISKNTELFMDGCKYESLREKHEDDD